jgi:hypothetical protein
MICPVCKAEYRQGFTRCVDCDAELVENYADAARHLLAKKAVVPDKYGTLLWRGTDPHFYVTLLWSLWHKKVACYGKPENPPIPEFATGPQPGASEPGGFEAWVSNENLPLAKWILDSANEKYEREPPEEPAARTNVMVREGSSGTAAVCPLCLGEFTAASSNCPNCRVPLRYLQPDMDAADSTRRLCNSAHPKFITELRGALQAAAIPFNNANFSSGSIILGRHYVPNYEILVLDEDFERATRVMSQILQRWEFEPSAGFGVGEDPETAYWPVRASENGWLRKDISVLVWSGQSLLSLSTIGMALQEHEIPYRAETEQIGMAKVFSHPEDEARAREIVREVVEGAPPE